MADRGTLTNSSVVWGMLDSRSRVHAGEAGHAGVATFQHEVNFIHSIPFLLLMLGALLLITFQEDVSLGLLHWLRPPQP